MSQSIKLNDNNFIDAEGVWDSRFGVTLDTISNRFKNTVTETGNITWATGVTQEDYHRIVKAGPLVIMHIEFTIGSDFAAWATIAQLQTAIRPNHEAHFCIFRVGTLAITTAYISSGGTLQGTRSIPAGTWYGDVVFNTGNLNV